MVTSERSEGAAERAEGAEAEDAAKARRRRDARDAAQAAPHAAQLRQQLGDRVHGLALALPRRRRHRRRRQTGAGADDFAEGAGVLAADQAQQPTGAAAHRTGAAGAAQITCRFIRTMFNQVK